MMEKFHRSKQGKNIEEQTEAVRKFRDFIKRINSGYNILSSLTIPSISKEGDRFFTNTKKNLKSSFLFKHPKSKLLENYLSIPVERPFPYIKVDDYEISMSRVKHSKELSFGEVRLQLSVLHSFFSISASEEIETVLHMLASHFLIEDECQKKIINGSDLQTISSNLTNFKEIVEQAADSVNI